MEVEVKTLNEDGSIRFEGTLREREVSFVLEVGINFLLANGASPFIQDEDEVGDTMVGPSTDTAQ